jgi:uncharacterized protein (UPF0332 family)
MKMSLKKWISENKLSNHKTSKEEIQNLLKLVERDIQDANIDLLSNDRRFITAYNAAHQLATCVLYVSGHRTRPSKGGHHWISFAVLPDIMGESISEYADYFDTCRVKRNISDYTSVDEISRGEAQELIKEVIGFRKIVRNWIGENHLEYV